MTSIKDIYYIDINWIDEQISRLEKDIDDGENESIILLDSHELAILKRFKVKLKPIQPLIENAFDKGRAEYDPEFFRSKDIYEKEREEYINNKQFNLCT